MGTYDLLNPNEQFQCSIPSSMSEGYFEYTYTCMQIQQQQSLNKQTAKHTNNIHCSSSSSVCCPLQGDLEKTEDMECLWRKSVKV